MPVEVSWVNEEKTILQYTVTGAWTWDEFYPEYDKAIAMEKSVSHFVDIIFEMREARGVPPSALTHLRSISDKQPDNVGVTVVITQNAFVKTMVDIGYKVYNKIGHYFRVTTSIEEALVIIEDIRNQRETSYE